MSENPQYIRTDKAIKQSLITLLKSKPFEKITIQDILDETPVTRSTFYKHYHDKYEIAEKMQEEFFDSLFIIRQTIYENPNQSPSLINGLIKISQENRDIMDALLKIHTEHIDLREAFNNLAKEYYFAGITGEHPELEAEVFASAVTAFQISLGNPEILDIDIMYDVFISITMRLLGIPEDEEVRKLLKKKIIHPNYSTYKNMLPPKSSL